MYMHHDFSTVEGLDGYLLKDTEQSKYKFTWREFTRDRISSQKCVTICKLSVPVDISLMFL